MRGLLGWANALTGLRALLIVPSVWSIQAGEFASAAVVFCLAVATDLADGPVARARGEVSPLGGLFDHSVDAAYVATALGAFALADWGSPDWPQIPLALPVLIVLSFAQYALDSRVMAGRPLRASALGRYNGIGYFVLLGVVVIGLAIGLPTGLLNPLVSIAAWLLLATTLGSMLDRLLALRRARD